MQIKNLQLTNFRNYSKLDLDFENQPTIFLGSNGAGKSNILEAVYLLSTSKSPRVEEEIELIKKGQEAATVKGEIEQDQDTNEQSSLASQDELMVTMVGDGEIQRFGKRVAINGVPKRVIDFIGTLPTVIFWPSDINMVTGSPSLRRWHLDLALAQSSQTYKKSLTLYEQVLTSRNRVLKRINEGQGRVDELEYWTTELVKYGQIVFAKRKEFFDFINKFESFASIHSFQAPLINNMQNPLGNFVFQYVPNVLSVERLEQYKDREIPAMSTLIGPHRDDFEILMGERDMSKFGSRGEQRMATLGLKMAQLEFMSHVLGKRPILLLDDVFSELDESHRAIVANISLMQQTLIATVELENIPQDFLDQARIINIEAGEVRGS